MSRIATGTGDQGETGLYGGDRVAKTHPRIAAYGTVDELNAHLGLAAAALEGELTDVVETLQHRMFHLGADLASPPSEESRRIKEAHVAGIEGAIDDLESELDELDEFVLPGGGEAGARLHLARTVCRRAERLAWQVDDVNPQARVYLNRLSDYLFLLARKANAEADTPEPRVDYD